MSWSWTSTSGSSASQLCSPVRMKSSSASRIRSTFCCDIRSGTRFGITVRHAHRCERVVLVLEQLHAKNLAVAEGPQHDAPGLHADAASPAAPAHEVQCDQLIRPARDQLLRV